MASVELIDVAKRYGKQTVLQPLDLTIPDGSFTVLVGPSGCGKSTLLRLLAGLETLSGGTILMNQRPVNDLDPADRDVAMVFQSYALYPHLTVAENLAFHMQVKKVDKQLQKSKVQQVASLDKSARRRHHQQLATLQPRTDDVVVVEHRHILNRQLVEVGVFHPHVDGV